MADEEKPLNHPDYVIGRNVLNGTTMVSFSKWSRENVPKDPPRHKVGERVVAEVVVSKVYDDCDGTPLFAVGHGDGVSALYGFDNDALTPATWTEGTPPDETRAATDLWAWCWQDGEGFPVFTPAGRDLWPANASHWRPVARPYGPEGRYGS